MLADTRAYGFDRGPVGAKDKVFRTDDGCLVGISSNTLGLPEQLRAWVLAGMPEDCRPRVESEAWCEVLMVHSDGTAALMNKTLAPARVTGELFAVGSGKEYALAALHLGHRVVDALGVACKLDPWSEFPLSGYDHEGREHRVPGPTDVRQYLLDLKPTQRDAQ